MLSRFLGNNTDCSTNSFVSKLDCPVSSEYFHPLYKLRKENVRSKLLSRHIETRSIENQRHVVCGSVGKASHDHLTLKLISTVIGNQHARFGLDHLR